MLFCSQAFVFFFALVFLTYWALPWQRARIYLLLVTSFYFYSCWNQWLACVIALSTTIDYFLARGMDHFTSSRWRRLMVWLSVGGNLGLLCYFKYANFFLQSLEETLQALGASASLPVLSVILPVGISFYTFEAISYSVDVYRRKIPAERDLANFMVFILFFPHLVAGPIVRARDFLPQARRPKKWDWARMQLGVEFILMGLFKKLVIADRMAVFVDPVFADPGAYRCWPTWLAMFAYALQVYGDFSGYTDIAIGCAHLLGYKLAQNFNMPYLSANIAEFWRRWHISLSSWLRDYLFFPLGGSRGSGWLTARNLLITMGLCGLWHGACWQFVLFGLIQGALLMGHRIFQQWAQGWPGVQRVLQSFPGTILRVAFTFLTMSFFFLLFRATSLENYAAIVRGLFTPNPDGFSAPAREILVLFAYGIVGLCHWVAYQTWWKRTTVHLPSPLVGFGYAVALMAALLLAPQSGQAFIYFQF